MVEWNLNLIRQKIRRFNKARNWEQFHSPKNLAMALSVEAAELLEHFQWLTPEESRNLPPEKLRQIEEEIGDIMVYLINLSDKLDIDPLRAADKKYPDIHLRASIDNPVSQNAEVGCQNTLGISATTCRRNSPGPNPAPW